MIQMLELLDKDFKAGYYNHAPLSKNKHLQKLMENRKLRAKQKIKF